MNRRQMGIAIGFLTLSIGLVAPAEAGGRRRPAPQPPVPTVTQVTVVNKTAKNLFVQVGDAGQLPDRVGAALTAGAKTVNAGTTAVFTTVKAGENDVRVTDMAVLNNLSIPQQFVSEGSFPRPQQWGDSFSVVANKNTTVEVTQQPPNSALVITIK
jgi:hypothetical protein